MRSDPDKLLNQLVVAALTTFIVVVMLLAALVLRQLWLQQRIAELSSEVQVSLNDLEEITEDVQRELNEAQDIENWEEMTEALDDVDEQLGSIGENLEDLNEVAPALEPQVGGNAALTGDEKQADVPQDQVDQVFTVFAIIVGVASIGIAVLLGMAVRVHQSTKDHHL